MNAILREQQRNQQQQELLRQEQERKAREGAGRQTIIPREVPQQPTLPQDNACIDADRIEVTGAVILSETEIAALIAPYLKRCLTLADINELMKDITKVYVDRGLVAVRVYLPPQEMTNGLLIIEIVEGKVEAVEPSPPDSVKFLELAMAFPGVIGRPLDLRDFEQGLDQMNRLRSNNATMKLEPGKEQGDTRVIVENQPKKRWRVGAGFGNGGSDSTGRYKYSTTGEIDDLLGLNDYLYVAVDRSQRHEHSWRGARSLNGNYTLPYGYWTLSLNASYSDYASPVFGTAATYVSQGNSRTMKAEVERVLHRDSEGKTTANVLFRTYSAASYFDDIKIDASTYKLAVAGAGLSHSRKLLGGTLSARGLWEQGVDRWHAKGDAPNIAKDAAHAQFGKASADLGFGRSFPIGEAAIGYSGAAHAQWSKETLYSPERISLGGSSSVRGFDAQYISGDTGGYVRNELSLTLPPTGVDWIDETTGRISPFLAYDIGALRHDMKDDAERGVVSGWAAGIRTTGIVNLNFTYAQALRTPSFIRSRDHETAFTLTLNY